MKRTIILIALALTGCSDSEPDPTGSADRPAVSTAPVASEAVEASLKAAEEFFQTRDLAKAEAILLRLLDRVPNQPSGLEMYGQVLLAKAADARERGDHDAAKQMLDDAYGRYAALVQLQPSSPGLQQSAGEVAQVAGRRDDALKHYQAAQKLDPDNPKPLFLAAQIYLEQQEYERARLALGRVLELDPDEPLAYASLASIAVQQERFDDAMKYIVEARDIRPRDVSFRVIEASILRMRGEPELAVQLLLALSQQQRGSMFVAAELAAAQVAMGDHQQAGETWALAHRSNPRHPQAYLAAVRAGEAMLRAGSRDEARHWLSQARLQAPNAPETKQLAEAFAQQGEPDASTVN